MEAREAQHVAEDEKNESYSASRVLCFLEVAKNLQSKRTTQWKRAEHVPEDAQEKQNTVQRAESCAWKNGTLLNEQSPVLFESKDLQSSSDPSDPRQARVRDSLELAKARPGECVLCTTRGYTLLHVHEGDPADATGSLLSH